MSRARWNACRVHPFTTVAYRANNRSISIYFFYPHPTRWAAWSVQDKVTVIGYLINTRDIHTDDVSDMLCPFRDLPRYLLADTPKEPAQEIHYRSTTLSMGPPGAAHPSLSYPAAAHAFSMAPPALPAPASAASSSSSSSRASLALGGPLRIRIPTPPAITTGGQGGGLRPPRRGAVEEQAICVVPSGSDSDSDDSDDDDDNAAGAIVVASSGTETTGTCDSSGDAEFRAALLRAGRPPAPVTLTQTMSTMSGMMQDIHHAVFTGDVSRPCHALGGGGGGGASSSSSAATGAHGYGDTMAVVAGEAQDEDSDEGPSSSGSSDRVVVGKPIDGVPRPVSGWLRSLLQFAVSRVSVRPGVCCSLRCEEAF